MALNGTLRDKEKQFYQSLVSGNGTVEDNKAKYFQSQTGIGHPKEAEKAYLRTLGATGRQLDELWNSFLNLRGYVGTLTDKLQQFYQGGSFITDVTSVLNRLRGWNYSSNYTSGSSSNPWYQESQMLDNDATDISAAGITVVKIYGTELNSASHLSGIDAMLAVNPSLRFLVLDFVTYGTDYSVATGGANRSAKIADFEALVTTFSQRSEVIGYGFGNENNINLGTTSAADWYSLVDAACVAGKAIDDTRMFFTVDADLGTYPGDVSLPNLDALGLNIYRGKTFTDLTTDITTATSKPVFLSEFGRSRTSNNESNQNTQGVEVLGLIKEAEDAYPTIRGWVHFKYTDFAVPGTVYGSTEPLADNVDAYRAKYQLYDKIKYYCNRFSYGQGTVYSMRKSMGSKLRTSMNGNYRVKQHN